MIASYMRGRTKCSAPAATKNGPQSARRRSRAPVSSRPARRPRRRRRPGSPARASQPRRRSSPKTSGGCAPDAPSARSTTKNGTAWMPSCAAARSSSRTSAAKRSPASSSRTSSAGSPASTPRRSSVGRVADRLALGEVGAHEALLHRVLRAVGGGEVQQAVGVERVAAAGDVEAELEALLGRDVGHPLLHRDRLLAARAVLLGEVRGAVDARARAARPGRARSCAT